jgi:hypothetical protein
MKSHSEKPADRNDGEGKMSKRPLAASRLWTPAEEEKLQALAASGEGPPTIAEQLDRSTIAVLHRSYKLGIRFKRTMIASNERTFATHPERQFMERLRGRDWVKGATLPSSRLTVNLQNKCWIEQQLQGPKNEIFYRITDVGLEALKAPVPRSG